MRTAQYKYVQSAGDPVRQLFDMKNDPWEMNNLYKDPKYGRVMADPRKLLGECDATLIPA